MKVPWGIAITLALAAASCSPAPAPSPQLRGQAVVLVAGQQVLAELAEGPEEMAAGLSGRAALAPGQGMLFDFSSRPQRPAFWMKGMNFGLDIIWIRNGKILEVEKNLPPPAPGQEPLPVYRPPAEIDYVLEVPAGWSDSRGIAAGQEARIVSWPDEFDNGSAR